MKLNWECLVSCWDSRCKQHTNSLKGNFSVLSSAASLLPHRFVTVRRGSPASRSGQIRPGDRLEAVEGRSVVGLPHRELAQILRRAGNTLRLTIVPRPSTCEYKWGESYILRNSSPSIFTSLVQILPAFQKPLRMTLVTEAERVRGRVQRWGHHKQNCPTVMILVLLLTVLLSPSGTPGITVWTWIEALQALASASEGAVSTTWGCTSWDWWKGGQPQRAKKFRFVFQNLSIYRCYSFNGK